MRFPGRVYQGQQAQYLAIYNYYPDIYVAAPPSVEDFTRLAHVAYSEGGKRSGIDIFLLKQPVTDIKPTIKHTNKGDRIVGRSLQVPEIEFLETVKTPGRPESDRRFDIGYELVPEASDEAVALIRTDVEKYCKRDAKTSGGVMKRVQQIIPVTKALIMKLPRVLTSGKQEFTPQCLLTANIDFSWGCPTGWIPGQNASYDGETFTNFLLNPFAECDYCYAAPKHECFPKNLVEIDFDWLKWELRGGFKPGGNSGTWGRKVDVLRLGKRTETGSNYTLAKLMLTLEACYDTKTRVVIPTKMARYSKDLADLLKKTNSVLLPSIGFDELEKGACAHGCTNEWRLEQAVKFAEQGVKVIPYLLIANPVLSPTERDLKLFDFFNQHKDKLTGVQVLPMRFGSKDLCQRCTGYDWDLLKRRMDQQTETLTQIEDPELIGSYVSESGSLLPNTINKEWLNLIGNNKGFCRMCHHTSSQTYCGSCFLAKGSITPRKKIRMQSRARKKISKEKLPLFDI